MNWVSLYDTVYRIISKLRGFIHLLSYLKSNYKGVWNLPKSSKVMIVDNIEEKYYFHRSTYRVNTMHVLTLCTGDIC